MSLVTIATISWQFLIAPVGAALSALSLKHFFLFFFCNNMIDTRKANGVEVTRDCP